MTTNELEFQKLIFEIFQQLTTLNTAVALIVPAVAKTLDLDFWISVPALGCFFFSVIFSGWGMWKTAERVEDGVNGAPTSLLILAWFFIIAGVVYFSYRTIRERG